MNLPPALTALLAIPLPEPAAPSADAELFSALVEEHLALDQADSAEVKETAVDEQIVEAEAVGAAPVIKKPKRHPEIPVLENLRGMFILWQGSVPAPPKEQDRGAIAWTHDLAPIPDETALAETAATEKPSTETAATGIAPSKTATPPIDTVLPDGKKATPLTPTLEHWTPAAIPEDNSVTDEWTQPPAGVARVEPTLPFGPPANQEQPNDPTVPATELSPPVGLESIAKTSVHALPAVTQQSPGVPDRPPRPDRIENALAEQRQTRAVENVPAEPVPAKSTAPIAFALSLRVAERAPDRHAPDHKEVAVERETHTPKMATETKHSGADERPQTRVEVPELDEKLVETTGQPVRPTHETQSLSAAVNRTAELTAPVAAAPSVASAPLYPVASDRSSADPKVSHPVATTAEVRPGPEIRSSAAPLEIRIDLPNHASQRVDHLNDPLTTEAPHVQLQLREHRGEVTVSVRTADAALSQSLHERLPELVARLEGQGYETGRYETRASDGPLHVSAETLRSTVEASSRGEESSDQPPPRQQSQQEQHQREQHQGEAERAREPRQLTRQAARWLAAWQTNSTKPKETNR